MNECTTRLFYTNLGGPPAVISSWGKGRAGCGGKSEMRSGTLRRRRIRTSPADRPGPLRPPPATAGAPACVPGRHGLREIGHLIQPRLEIVPRPHCLVDQRAGRQSVQRGVAEFPMWAVEDKTRDRSSAPGSRPSADERRTSGPLPQPSTEVYSLPGIRVGQPLVHHQRSDEVPQVRDLRQKSIGKEIIHRQTRGIARVTGAEVPAGLNRYGSGAQLDASFGILRTNSREMEMMAGSGAAIWR